MGLPAADKIAIRAYEFACTSLTAVGVVHPHGSACPIMRENSRGCRISRAPAGAFKRDHFDTDVPCALIIRWRVVVTPCGSGIFLRSGNIACVRERLSDSLNTFQDRSEGAFQVLRIFAMNMRRRDFSQSYLWNFTFGFVKFNIVMIRISVYLTR